MDELEKLKKEKDVIYANYKTLEKAYTDLIKENMRLEEELKKYSRKFEDSANNQ